jgi:hypothetical protein
VPAIGVEIAQSELFGLDRDYIIPCMCRTGEAEPMPLTANEIKSVLGPVDDTLIAELMSTGASYEDLREASGWLNSDEALMGSGRSLPGSRIAELIELLDPEADEP